VNAEQVEQQPVWTPTRRQAAFLASSAYETLYGGAAGGGKTQALVAGALRHIDKASYNAIVFRRTFPELKGEVIPVSRELYPRCGGRYNANDYCWTFPSGARIHFGHLQHEHDVERYQGWQFQYVGYDELTHFTEHQYVYIVNSRVRSADGIPARIRAGTNPGGNGHEWVMRRWAPWLDPDFRVRAKPHERLYYRNTKDGEEWLPEGVKGPLSRVFIPSTLQDNPYLTENDPAYRERLLGLDRVSRAQLLEGDWLAKASAGAFYKRGWFRVLDVAPANVVQRIRRWDLAATPPSETNKDPDWTVGIRMAKTRDGLYVIEDIVRIRESPGVVEQTIKNTAAADGPTVTVSIPQDPGQAGKSQSRSLATLLAGYPFTSRPETGDKVTRQKPFSAQVEAGNVAILRGAYLDKFLAELEGFPDESMHDDQVDAAAGAFADLCSPTARAAQQLLAMAKNR
jgi:predicted phage terminase large subunit-like protein